MRLPHRALVLASLPLLVLACSSAAQKSGFDTNNSATSGGSGDAGPTLTGNDPGSPSPSLEDGGSSANDGVDTSGYNVPTKLGCASRAQEILILDFRSGWWAGGGGGDFASVALGAVVGACPQTSVDYHHFENVMHAKCLYQSASGGGCQMLQPSDTVDAIRATFVHASVSDYTQIWVLSGSDQDPSDIPVGDQLFQGLMGDTKGACIPMLVASGDGFMTHANTVANDLGMGNVFSQQTNPPSFFSVADEPAQAMNSLSGSSLASHILFTGVSSIVDQVGSYEGQARADALAESVPAPATYQVIAHDSFGSATIAVGAAKLSGDGYRPFIFDSGWQRMYALGQDEGTGQYLKNIVMYLSLVGCKAAPIGPPK